jgi:MSHA pilin protein MshA
MPSKTSQHGFTMIELIVVIVILGVLSAVALPRFTNMQRDARIAKLNAARGAVTAAASMVHGSAMARQGTGNQACPTGGNANIAADGTGTLCTENGTVQVTLLYPGAKDNAGIVAAAGLVQTGGIGAPSATQLAADGYQATVAGGTATIAILGGETPANCSFQYVVPNKLGAGPTISKVTTTGC